MVQCLRLCSPTAGIRGCNPHAAPCGREEKKKRITRLYEYWAVTLFREVVRWRAGRTEGNGLRN